MIPLHELIDDWKAQAKVPVETVERPCLCGGRIRTLKTERSIADAVLTHNRSTRHVEWATRAGWR